MVRVECDGPVATVILDRPDVRNAVDGPTAASLYDAFCALDAANDVSAVVLWGANGTFCSGADLTAIGTDQGNTVQEDGPGPMGPTRMILSKPVIGAIEGYAVAGGLELALWCDLRVAADSAVLGVFCRRWGVPLIDGGTVRLPRIVGFSRAMDMVLTGRSVGASEAKEIGLIDRIVPEGRARQEAERLASDLAALPQECLRNDRLSMYEGATLDEAEALRNEFSRGMATITHGDMPGDIGRFLTGEGRHGVERENLT